LQAFPFNLVHVERDRGGRRGDVVLQQQRFHYKKSPSPLSPRGEM
jgi:hypothetical protein